MNQELILKFITPLGLDSANWKWGESIVVHEGRAVTIQIPEYVATSRGALPASATLAKNNFELFANEQTQIAIASIEAQIAEEKNELEKIRSQYEAKFATLEVVKASKRHKFTKFLGYKTYCLLGLATIFNFLMCLININHFFGATFEDMTNRGFSWVFVSIMALLIAGSTPFFAMLKNQKMVNKTIFILPIDMLIAYLYSNGVFNEAYLKWFGITTAVIYTIILVIIIWAIMKVLVGKGISDEAQHYESITSALLD